MRIELQRVEFIPKALEPGVLYVAEKYGAAAHLCACGCGSKIRTPLAPTEWTVVDSPLGVTLHPSVGNWQQPCKSHYWIEDGEVLWSDQWSEEEIEAGRRAETARRMAYYSRGKIGPFRHLWRSLRRFFR